MLLKISAGDTLVTESKLKDMIFLEELNNAGRRAVLGDTIFPMHSAEVLRYAQAGTLFAEIGLRAEAMLEGVTVDKLLEDLGAADVRALADAVAALRLD